jgi:hypothetical protein
MRNLFGGHVNPQLPPMQEYWADKGFFRFDNISEIHKYFS